MPQHPQIMIDGALMPEVDDFDLRETTPPPGSFDHLLECRFRVPAPYVERLTWERRFSITLDGQVRPLHLLGFVIEGAQATLFGVLDGAHGASPQVAAG